MKIEKKIKRVKKIIKELRKNQREMREIGVMANNYDYKESKIYRKGWNDAMKWFKEDLQTVQETNK